MGKSASVDRLTHESDTFRSQDGITLGVLTAIERDANLSQRMISNELGVALGLANSYLKRCVRKGWIKIQQVPRRRYVYYLTPQGFSEKARLTGNYLSASFTFFRRARAQMSDFMELCVDNGWQRIAFAGVSELAEVGILCAQDFEITIVGVIDPTTRLKNFRRLKVASEFEALENVDAVIVTDLLRPDVVCKTIKSAIGTERTLIPPLLQLSPRKSGAGE